MMSTEPRNHSMNSHHRATHSGTNRSSRRASDSGSYTDYSESFYSEDDSPVSRQAKSKGRKTQATGAKKSVGQTGHGEKAGKGRAEKTSKPSPRHPETVAQRMLSAGRNKVQRLRSEKDEANTQITELRLENKILKKQQHLQEKALRRFEGEEGEITSLLRRHSAEVNALTEQLRRQRAAARLAETRLKTADEQLNQTKRQLAHMSRLVADGGLDERDELTRKLQRAEADSLTHDRRNKELEMHIEHLKKNHRHEIGIERARQRDIQRELAELREQCGRKDIQLKEKEKELDIRNIYSNRLLRPPHRISSVRSSPAPGSRASLQSHSNQQRSQTYDNQRRETQLQHTQEKEQKARAEQETLAATIEAEHQAALQASQELREREWWQAEQVQRREREAEQIREQQDEMRQKEEEAKEEKLRKERDELEKEEKQRKEDERNRKEDEAKLATEHEARLRAQEEEQRRAREEAERVANTASDQVRRRTKDALLAKLHDIDNTPQSPAKTARTFPKSVENMHNGLPAADSAVHERKHMKSFFDDIDSDYKPSFGVSRRDSGGPFGDRSNGIQQNKQNTAKSDLMAQLFGSQNGEKERMTEQSSSMLFGGGSAIIDDKVVAPFSSKPHMLPRRSRQPATTIHTKPTINAIVDLDDDLEEVAL